jgi:hypothetical protein
MEPVAETPVAVVFALALTVTVPMDPVADTPISVLLETVTVPTAPVAETPVTATPTVAMLPEKGAVAKGTNPNMCKPPFLCHG